MSSTAAKPAVSVVMPTHNPRMDYLQRVLEALRVQTLPREQWELLVVDNNSQLPLRASTRQTANGKRQETSLPSHLPTCPPFTEIDLSWHPDARVVREERLGLTNAWLRGFAETSGDVLVLVDDENVLALDHLMPVSSAGRETASWTVFFQFGAKSVH